METHRETVTSITYNTCYFTEDGILPCNRKRKELAAAVEVMPKVEVNGVATSWEEILPTRVIRMSVDF